MTISMFMQKYTEIYGLIAVIKECYVCALP